nr:hypothetical protein [Tanacetum cinerariifolium]
MEEYTKLEAEKVRRRGQTFSRETATLGKFRYYEDIDYFKEFDTDFSAIVFNDTVMTNHKISLEPTVNTLDENQNDFRISFDESDDEDYTNVESPIEATTLEIPNASTCGSKEHDGVSDGAGNIVSNEPVMNEVPLSYATKLSPTSLTKANLRKLEANVPNDVYYDVWLHIALVHEVNDRINNSLYGYSIGKRLAFLVVEILVENAKNRVRDWKNRVTSYARRVQLIQSVLHSMYS